MSHANKTSQHVSDNAHELPGSLHEPTKHKNNMVAALLILSPTQEPAKAESLQGNGFQKLVQSHQLATLQNHHNFRFKKLGSK